MKKDKRNCNEKNVIADAKDFENYYRAAALKTVSGFVLTGGEPTLNQNIFEIINKAGKIKLKEIFLETNGRMFKYPDYCKDIKKTKLSKIIVSLHGSDEKAHDFFTNAKGSFSDTAVGIINMKKFGFYVISHTTVTKANQQDIPNLARLLCALNVNEIVLNVLNPDIKYTEKFNWILPYKDVLSPFIKQAQRIVKNKKIKFSVNW